MIEVVQLAKSFTLHNQGGVTLSVLNDVSLDVKRGECLALCGPSGSGKSTLIRCLYANYGVERGEIRVRHDGDWLDLARASARKILEVRRSTMGYVSQFLRVIPRIPAIDIVIEPLLALGIAREEARARGEALLDRFNVPSRLRSLPPATFSGGEQQRINVARGIIAAPPILLLDEPTAALDHVNRAAVIDVIRELAAYGAAIVGVFHDKEVREAVANRKYDLQRGHAN
ncbi:MAG: phosphonate C-P lyase system protein PhnL [Burkholderiales bacterium]